MNMTKLEQLHQKYGEEQVLCVPTEALSAFAEGTDPILYDTQRVIECIQSNGIFKLRYQVELDSSFKQIIPYVVMQTDQFVLAAKRLKGDSRLVGGYSVGMGGHINPEDCESEDACMLLEACIRRELEEETTFLWERDYASYRLHDKSFVNVRNEVSLMHLCIPVLMWIKKPDHIQIREVEKLQGAWTAWHDVPSLAGKLEGWSEIALELFRK